MDDGFTAQSAGGLVWAGIDPGKHGYVVAIHPDNTLTSWPNPVDGDGDYLLLELLSVARELARLGVHHVTVEAQQPTHMRPGQQAAGMMNSAVRASFMTGYGFALWEMALTAAGFKRIGKTDAPGGSYDFAWPSHWKKQMGITVPKGFDGSRETEAKNLARMCAVAMWPDHDFRKNARSKPSPDQCEAALIALYGMQKHAGV